MVGSSDANGDAGRDALARLEAAIQRVLGELEDARQSASTLGAAAERSGALDVEALRRRVDSLREENDSLRERLTRGFDIAERLAAKIRFLEEKK